MFCFVFFRFIFRQRGMTGNLNTIEKKPVVVKLSALVSFFRAQSSSSSPCVCARPSKCQQYTRQTVRHAQGEDGADVSTSIIDPFLPSVSHQGPSVLCVCARLGRRRCALFSSSADLLRTRAAEWANKLTRAPLHHILHLMVLITKGSTRLETESI